MTTSHVAQIKRDIFLSTMKPINPFEALTQSAARSKSNNNTVKRKSLKGNIGCQ
jgi:hypothetical protein